jgi:hypothetical protein
VSSADRGVRAAEVRMRQSVSRVATVCGQRPGGVWLKSPGRHPAEATRGGGACPSMLSG